MRFRKRQRLVLLVVGMLLLSGATALVLASLQDSIAFFATPSELASRQVEPGKTFRIGGLVVEGSVVREADGTVRFAITDTAEEVPVVYRGLLPDLFREGQGVVALGKLGEDGTFLASEVLAKHDEEYMPREVSDALKEAGYWEDQEEAESAR